MTFLYTLTARAFLLFILLFPPKVVATPTAVANPLVAIRVPRPGQVLQGLVPIQGSTDIPGFQSAELLFAYIDDPTDTWFLIQTLEEPVAHGLLAEWDTSLITDGDYQLRLIVILENGTRVMAQVKPLRVRNYTPIETDTPAPTESDYPLTAFTASPTMGYPTLTPLPTNPAILTMDEMRISVTTGAAVALVTLALGVSYFALKHYINKNV